MADIQIFQLPTSTPVGASDFLPYSDTPGGNLTKKVLINNVPVAQSQVTNLVSDLGLKAPSASPTLTGDTTITGVMSFPNNTANLIFVSIGGSDTVGVGDGTEWQPYRTIPYALTQASAGKAIVVTPGTYPEAVALLPHIPILGYGSTVSIISGNVTIDGPAWSAASGSSLYMKGCSLTGTANLSPPYPQFSGSSLVTLDDVSLPSGSTLGEVNTIRMLNGCNGNNLSILGCADAQVIGCPLTGSLTVNEASASFGGTFFIDGALISTLNATALSTAGSVGVTVLNSINLSNGGTVNYDDQSGGGGYLTVYCDSDSFPATIVDVESAGNVQVYLIPPTCQANFLKANQAKIEDTVLFRTIPRAYNTNSGTTVTGGDLLDGAITVNPSAAQTISFESAANIVTAYTPRYGAIEEKISFETTFSNQSAFNSVITAGANTSFFVSGATSTVQANSSVIFRFVRIGSTFVIYGGLPLLAVSSSVVHTTGNETVAGVKNFTDVLLNHRETTSLSVTTSLTAAQLIKGLIYATGLAADITFTFPTASSIKTAMLGSSLGSTINVEFVNLDATYNVNFANSDSDLLVTGVTSFIVRPLQTTYLEFTVTDAGVPQVTVTGNTGLPNFTTFALDADVVHDSGNETISGNKSFTGITDCSKLKVDDNPLFNVTPHAYNATSGSTVSASDLSDGVITVNPVLAQSITFDTAANIDSELVTRFGTVNSGDAIKVTYDNESAVASVITAGANCTFSIGGATATVLAGTSRSFVVTKASGTPTYLIFG